jgi:multicomponent Na+:H+ antiporter subunit A
MSVTLVALFAPFVAALFAPVLAARAGKAAAWLLAILPFGLFVHWSGFVPEIAAGERLTGGVQWIPALSVNFSWFIDGLSLTFALLISGIGTLIIVYAGAYLEGHRHLGRFLSFMLLFMGAMQGLVLADSFMMLFVFWELTSITSFLLIGFDHERTAARRAALQALVITGMGGLALLAGLVVLWNIAGVSEMSLLLATGDTLRQSPFYLLALVLVLAGAFTKSAQFPLHFWLPNAMEAPTPVSAYLHSATMVKAGVYLLMRLNPVLGETGYWHAILPLFGGVTLMAGAVLAVRQTDLKQILAYTTMASLGLLVALIGIGSKAALAAAALYLVAHALFKGALFMVAGAIDHGTGTRDIRQLAGLRRAMPLTFAAAILAALAMGGILPFYGFIAKEAMYEALLHHGPGQGGVLLPAFIAGNALMFAAAFSVGWRPFAGSAGASASHAHDGGLGLLLGPMVLALAGLAAGLAAPLVHQAIAEPLAGAIAAEKIAITLTALPHLNLAFGLSVLTIVLGIGFYAFGDRLRGMIAAVLDRIGWGPDKGFDQAVNGILNVAVAVTRVTQNGRIETYMTVTFVGLAAALWLPMLLGGELPVLPEFTSVRFYDAAIFLIALIGIVAVVRARDRLTAIVCLGVQGFAVSVLFMLYGAPDLSFTQFMIETLSVVILALVMTRLNLTPADHRSATETVKVAAIALAVGSGLTAMMLNVVQGRFDPALTDFFAAYSSTIAHGRNIVNVIIVDFRGVDTLGEIAVVAATGLAILALIRIRVMPNGKRREVREVR